MTDADIAACRKWAAFYRERGFNPLPSRPDAKRPFIKYADLWETPLPASEFERWETPNVQVMTGRFWGLLVIDLDGPEAVAKWPTMGRVPRTWTSHSGGGGRHVWFAVPKVGPSLSKAVLWKGEGEHSAIERLCDKSLVMAPPSLHPEAGRRYKWLDKRHSPLTVPAPAPCPRWVLDLKPVGQPKVASTPVPTTWRETIESIRDIPSLVRSWGVRTVGEPRSSGWQPCHAIDREDRKPSAAIHIESGYYVDSGSGARMGLVDLAVHLNVYSTPQEAIKELRNQYGIAG